MTMTLNLGVTGEERSSPSCHRKSYFVHVSTKYDFGGEGRLQRATRGPLALRGARGRARFFLPIRRAESFLMVTDSVATVSAFGVRFRGAS